MNAARHAQTFGRSYAARLAEGASMAPRSCSHTITDQHAIAQLAPSAQPASTSVGQCTPR